RRQIVLGPNAQSNPPLNILIPARKTVQQFLFVCNTILHLAEEIKSQHLMKLEYVEENCKNSERSKRELSPEDHKDSKTNDKQDNAQETVI
ncbi:unnamed protein product, partial [Oikopleura dioica]